jgi:predicted phage tail protein
MKKRAFLFGVLMLASAWSLGAGEKLVIQVSPAMAFAPANLRVRTMIEADVENRSVEVVAESEDFYRSSEVQLDGDRAPRTSVFEFRSLPPGAYDVTVKLLNASGRTRALARSRISVMPSGSGDR